MLEGMACRQQHSAANVAGLMLSNRLAQAVAGYSLEVCGAITSSTDVSVTACYIRACPFWGANKKPYGLCQFAIQQAYRLP